MIDDAPTLTRVCVLLVTVIEELRSIRSALSVRKGSKQPRTLSEVDVRALSELLPAIVAVMAGEDFTVRRLREAAQGRTRTANTLRAALAGAALNALQLGRLLRRAAESETPIGYLFVHRIGPSRDGVMFSVSAESREHHAAASISTALRGTITP